MISEDFTFKVGNNLLKGTIDKPTLNTPVRWLSLHGAGTAHRGLVTYISEHLMHQNQALMRFDFSGHGDSQGHMSDSSLLTRLEEAKTALKFLDTDSGIYLIGSSMGGHIAARLTQHVEVNHLILFYPGAYSRHAESLNFNESFSAAIRLPQSYQNSLAFEALKNFKGHLTVIIGSEDHIIPKKVIDLYLKSCPLAKSQRLLTIEGSPHRMHGWLDNYPVLKQTVLAAVTEHLIQYRQLDDIVRII